MSNKGTKAVIGTTRGWNAKESGKDLAEGLMEKLNENPDFIVLFSTIHYMKNGGFEHLLEGIYEVFPEDVKLVGGTVNGFLNNDGCFARGATALAVSSDELDVAISIGHNTKRNPKKAALQCVSDLKKNLSHSGFQNGFLLHIISGAEVPNIPPIGTKKIIKPGSAPNTLMKLFSMSQHRLQMGPSRDEEILEEMIGSMPDFSMLSGATLDDGHGIHNYQFYNRTVMKNAIVSLGLKTNKEIFVKSTTNLKRTDIEFDITKISGSVYQSWNWHLE